MNKGESMEIKSRSLIIGILLGAVIMFAATGPSHNGRYQLLSQGEGGALYVLDTRTSKLWKRHESLNIYMGTNRTPIKEHISK